jgi:hypothetical protein
VGWLALEALEPGLALRAALCALPPLVLVAVAADGEGALVARHEGLPVGGGAHVVAANLARPPVLPVQRLGLCNKRGGRGNNNSQESAARRRGSAGRAGESAAGARAYVPLARRRSG